MLARRCAETDEGPSGPLQTVWQRYTGNMPHSPYPPDEIRTPGGNLTEEAKAWFYEEIRLNGRNPYKVGEQLGISRPTVRKLTKKAAGRWADGEDLTPLQVRERMYQAESEQSYGDTVAMTIGPAITRYEDLSPVAQQAYNELGFWRRRYLGRRNILWQVEMCYVIMGWLEEARRENERVRGVLNTPPGGGKTTTVTHDFPGWVTSRERNIRISLGSRTTPQATAYSRRLRNTFERNTLLNLEFGMFKPEDPDMWRQDEFIVDGVTGNQATIEFQLALAGFDFEDPRVQARMENPEDEIHLLLKAVESAFMAGEKEATVKALSHQMGFLGGRFDLNLWDDLVDDKNSKTPEHRDGLAEWWEEYAVSRAEPGGIIALVGTRFGKYDLFRHCRDMVYTTDEDFDDVLASRISASMSEEMIAQIKDDLEKELYDQGGEDSLRQIVSLEPDENGIVGTQRMQHKVYRYMKFPAHNDSGCQNPSSLKAKDHIDCLLDPVRFRWHDLLRTKEANPRKYNLTYQQLDDSTEDNLIQEVWLTGGTDANGVIYPGCYNYGRRLLEIPQHLAYPRDGDNPKADCFSIATVDPSAVNFWSIQWWIWNEAEDKDYLLDLLRMRMSADSFLSYSTVKREYHGIVEMWQRRSEEMGWPISMWIVEQNAAQRYLFQHTWVNEWMSLNRVHIKGHESSPQKADEEYGVQILRPRYRHGLVDLPFSQDDMRTRAAITEFKQELTEWPDSPTDDMVHGHWFLEANRFKIPKELKVAHSSQVVRHPFQESMPQYLRDQTQMDRGWERETDRRPGFAASRRRARGAG